MPKEAAGTDSQHVQVGYVPLGAFWPFELLRYTLSLTLHFHHCVYFIEVISSAFRMSAQIGPTAQVSRAYILLISFLLELSE